jgi:Alkyl sulfatase C-terminal
MSRLASATSLEVNDGERARVRACSAVSAAFAREASAFARTPATIFDVTFLSNAVAILSSSAYVLRLTTFMMLPSFPLPRVGDAHVVKLVSQLTRILVPAVGDRTLLLLTKVLLAAVGVRGWLAAVHPAFGDALVIRVVSFDAGVAVVYKVLRFDFADGSGAGLHIRRAVAEFVASPDDHYREPDISLAMSGETWAKFYVSQATPGELIDSGEIKVTGDAAEAARLIAVFDRYVPEKAVVVPPFAFSSQR